MRSRLPVAVLGAATLLAGCATNGAVRRVETQVLVLRTETARQDSARAAEIERVLQTQTRVLDSLAAVREAVGRIKGDVAGDLFQIQQQLVQIQELTGQSQRRLSELRAQLDARGQMLAAQADTTPSGGPGDTTARAAPAAPPSEMFQAALGQFRRGSVGTARLGFQEFLRAYPNHEDVPAALLFLGETFALEAPDSASFYYRKVASEYASSDRAPTAWYKVGQLAELARDLPAARSAYQQVVQRYPRSPEANLARDRLASLRP